MTTLDSDLPHESLDEYETEPLPLPRRRRLPLVTALLALGVVAGGAFIGGVEVQKHEGGSTTGGAGSTASAFASRFGRGAATGSTAGGAGGAGSFFGGGGATIGTVTAIKGSTLYVTDSSGQTVKVTTSPAAAVTKTVSSSVKGIDPGDTVVVRGTAGRNGTVAAQSITDGSAGAAGGLGFGGGGSSGSGAATGFGGGGSSGSGAATGFGGGG